MKKIYLVIVLPLFIFKANAQDDNKDYSEAFALVEVWLEAQKDYEHLPGLSAIVVQDQEVVWEGAFGMANTEIKVKSTPATICSICSISKLFTSVAVMKLYDDGKLRLDDKIDDLLPWYNLEQKYPDSGPITVRTLLTHSSGLPRESNHPYWTGPDFPFPSREQIKEELANQETLYPASTYFQYSNLGLTLLGEIVEQVSGMPFDEYVTENILKPLNLSNTRTVLPQALYGSELAIGYSAMMRDGIREKVTFFQANGVKPAAGFSSNVRDLATFASWQFRLRDSTISEILKPSTLKYMQNVHWTDPDWETTWGLGFNVSKGADGDTWVSHGGSCPGYRSILMLNLKKKLAFSVMINASGANPGKYVTGINEILDKSKTNKDKDDTELEEHNLKQYIGYYNQQPWWSESYISTLNGQLVEMPLPVESPGKAMTFYKHIKGDVFRRVRDNEELGETMVFERDKNNNITHYKQHGNLSEKIIR